MAINAIVPPKDSPEYTALFHQMIEEELDIKQASKFLVMSKACILELAVLNLIPYRVTNNRIYFNKTELLDWTYQKPESMLEYEKTQSSIIDLKEVWDEQ